MQDLAPTPLLTPSPLLRRNQNIENQARGESDDGGCGLEGAILMDKRVCSCGAGGVCLRLDGGG